MFDSYRVKLPETALQEWMWKHMWMNDMSMDELADMMHCSRRTVQRHYSAGVPIAHHWFVAYCYVFGIEDINFEIINHKELIIT